MSTKAELQALLDRVKATTGPDRELDGDIWLAVVPGAVDEAGFRGMKYAGHVHTKAEKAAHIRNAARSYLSPTFTASLDAITALIERELPGRGYGFLRAFNAWGGWIFRTMVPARFGGGHDIGQGGATPALALTAAFLSAMIAQMGDEHAG